MRFIENERHGESHSAIAGAVQGQKLKKELQRGLRSPRHGLEGHFPIACPGL
jgi:hypothetical protein